MYDQCRQCWYNIQSFRPLWDWECFRMNDQCGRKCKGLIICDSYLIDLFLAWWGHRTVVSAVHLAVAVASFAISTGLTGMPQLLLLVTSLVLVFIVQHRLKIHYCPSMPGLPKDGTNWLSWWLEMIPCVPVIEFPGQTSNFSHPNMSLM